MLSAVFERRGVRTAGVALVAVAGSALAAWVIAGYLGRATLLPGAAVTPTPETGTVPTPPPGVGAPTASDLVKQQYNAVLRVQVQDEHGVQAAVGTALPRRLTIVLQDSDGRKYAEQFDRVGIWAIEVPPGTYVIPRDQPDLAGWKWTLTGEGLTPGATGTSVTFVAGRMHPPIDLTLH